MVKKSTTGDIIMLIELLSHSNYISFNIQLANLLGLHTAIYLAEIMSINEKAIKKNKVDGNTFVIDRNYIKNRTTIDEKEQLEIDKNLIKLNILEKKEDNNSLVLNLTTLTTIMMSTDEVLIDSIKAINTKKKTSKSTRAESIKDALKANIITTNVELRAAYESWIDSVYAKQGWMSKKSVVNAQSIVDDFSKRNLDIALSIIDIADTNGYRDMQWAVNKYKEQYKVSYIHIETNQCSPKLSSEVF